MIRSAVKGAVIVYAWSFVAGAAVAVGKLGYVVGLEAIERGARWRRLP